MLFYLIVTLLGAGDLLFWWWADRRLRHLRSPRPWRWLVGLLLGLQFLTLLWWLAFPGFLRGLGTGFWKPISAWLYMWHILVLPVTMGALLIGYAVYYGGKLLLRLLTTDDAAAPAPQTPASSPSSDARTLPTATGPAVLYPTRRQVLAAATTFVPQAMLGGTLLASAGQLGQFRVRNVTMKFPHLPAALSGMTIAHLSDTHVGRFVGARELHQIAAATAALKPDLIAFTGDLIDFNIADLPPAVSFLRDLRSIAPVATCVGNHDLFEDGPSFRRQLLTADVGLVADEVLPVTIRGHRLDLLGLDWGLPQHPRVQGLELHMNRLLSRYRPDAFSILLAHHPHAFDLAREVDIPLTLSGHTHGGQLMLTHDFGPGRVFKYWSGLYEKERSKLFVSNGVGNWFPLRINAPAEIAHITLTRG